MTSRSTQVGYTLIELIGAMIIAAFLLGGLNQFLGNSTSSMQLIKVRTDLARQARFAMTRMVDSTKASSWLFIPMSNRTASVFVENIREQTFPASAPPSGSTRASAVLAVTISSAQDMNGDGIADADNDNDGKIDEDLPADVHNDGEPGLRDFDDDGAGITDFGLQPSHDDDELNGVLSRDEDPLNGIDDDNDGHIDEDPPADNNDDNAPGVAGVDDDGDGSIDEGNDADDDEDGTSDEDWYDPVVFYLSGSSLIERRVVPWDESGDGSVNGRDWVESIIAENVSHLRFERMSDADIVDISITLTDPDGNTLSLNTQARFGLSL